MLTTKDDAIRYIKGLDVSPFVLRLYLREPVEHDLDIYIGCPEEFFHLSVAEQRVYSQGRLMPIVDDGNFDYITFHDPTTSGFVTMAVEDPDSDRTEYSRWQQFLVNLLFEIAETGLSNDELIEVGKYVGIRSPGDHLAFLDSIAHLPSREFWTRRAEHIAVLE